MRSSWESSLKFDEKSTFWCYIGLGVFLLESLRNMLNVLKMCLSGKEALVMGLVKSKKYIRTMVMILCLPSIIITVHCSWQTFSAACRTLYMYLPSRQYVKFYTVHLIHFTALPLLFPVSPHNNTCRPQLASQQPACVRACFSMLDDGLSVVL